MSELFNSAFKAEINTILQSFLEKSKDGGPPTIAKYDIPHISDLIAKRIVHRVAALEKEAVANSPAVGKSEA